MADKSIEERLQELALDLADRVEDQDISQENIRQMVATVRDEFPDATDEDVRAAFAEMEIVADEDSQLAQTLMPIFEKAIAKTGRDDLTFREAVETLGDDDPDVQNFYELGGRLFLRRAKTKGRG